MITVEIYFDDLTEEKQKEICEAIGVENGSDMNWDVLPIAVCDFEEEDEA
jgi:hypothetical protein